MTSTKYPLNGTITDTSEHDAQVTVIQWASWHEARYPWLKWLHATINGAKLPYRKTRGGKRYSPEAIRLKAEGLKPGIADLFLPVPMDGYCGLWLELKVGTNKPTDEQREFIADMNAQGYLAMATWGSKYTIACIATYMHIPQEEWW